MTRTEALDLANRHVARLAAGVPLAVNDALTEEHPAGLIFFYNTVRYWQTRDPLDAVAGNRPLLVRPDGRVTVLPSSRSIVASLAALAHTADDPEHRPASGSARPPTHGRKGSTTP